MPIGEQVQNQLKTNIIRLLMQEKTKRKSMYF